MSTLTEIQNELKAPKGRTNTFGNYKYRSCEDILEAVKPLLKKYDATLTLSDEIVAVGDRVYVKATATITASAVPYKVTAYAREAESKRGMDDSQITGTASSYARKYALNGLFLIDDTKDADTDEYNRQTASKESTIGKTKGTALEAMLKDAGQDPEAFLKYYKIEKLSELTEEQHRAIYEGIRKRNGNNRQN